MPKPSNEYYAAIRKANAEWSKEHSRMATSKWTNSYSDSKAEVYYQTFVNTDGISWKKRRERLHRWTVETRKYYQEPEFEALYPVGPE